MSKLFYKLTKDVSVCHQSLEPVRVLFLYALKELNFFPKIIRSKNKIRGA